MVLCLTAAVGGGTGVARADDVGDSVSTADDTQPKFSADDRWAAGLLWGVGGLFAAAAGIGGLVHLRARSLVPAAATHEEDPAADRH